MARAWVSLRLAPHYRSASFCEGLRRRGYEVRQCQPGLDEVEPGDVAVFWNRRMVHEPLMDQLHERGVKLVVAENGYYGEDPRGRQYYAMARDAHNGAGRWRWAPTMRTPNLFKGMPPREWRRGGRYILLADQRSIGSALMASPRDWEERARALCEQRFPGWEVRYRPHPGRHAPAVSLEEDMADARMVLTWGSQAATQAVLSGLPAFHMSPYHALSGLVLPADEFFYPETYERLLSGSVMDHNSLARMSWAQWSVEEIAAGVPFHMLLDEAPVEGTEWVGPVCYSLGSEVAK